MNKTFGVHSDKIKLRREDLFIVDQILLITVVVKWRNTVSQGNSLGQSQSVVMGEYEFHNLGLFAPKEL